MSELLNDRIVELETKVSFQEHALNELSDALAQQQRQIDTMEMKLRELQARFAAIQPSIIAHASEETPPPHY